MTDALQPTPDPTSTRWQALTQSLIQGIGQGVEGLPALLGQLSASQDTSWVGQWWPVLASLRRLGASLIRGLLLVRRAAAQGDVGLLFDDDLRAELMDAYDALLASIPEGAQWKRSIDRLDEMYMSWIQDPHKRDALWGVAKRVEAHADEWLAQLVTLIFSSSSASERASMVAFFDRAQGFVELAIDLIFDARMRAAHPPPEEPS